MKHSLRIHDLSLAFKEGMPKYPAPWFPAFRMKEIKPEDMPEAKWKRRFTALELFVHNGTHVESSDHALRDGVTIDRIPLTHYIGRPVLIDLTGHPDSTPITRDMLEHRFYGHAIEPSSIILLKTTYNDRQWGRERYWLDSPYLEPDAARFIAGFKPGLIGLDFQTEKPGEREFLIHRELLKDDAVLCEYLFNLNAIGPETIFMALPIKVIGAEAASVRAVAVDGLETMTDKAMIL